MVYRIKLISDEADGFLREISVDSESTFLDLNRAVLQACGYPDDQLTSFFLCDRDWERGVQVTREDMGVGQADQDVYVMADTRLSDLIDDEGQRLVFVFDPFADRCFYLDVRELLPGERLAAPRVTRAKGEAPRQIAELDADPAALLRAAKAAAPDTPYAADDDFLASSAYNDDEIDPDGFEISDGAPY